jgi:tetraacyldisaccharide 4'-kinase
LRAVLFRVLSWGFGLGTALRNYLYDRGILASTSFNLPVICVGNLSVGGSGKTPHVEHIVKMLLKDWSVVVLSRGYGRKTKGFVWADSNSTPESIGDEPFMYFKKLNVPVAVCEKRVLGVKEILSRQATTQVIVMDDGFQHRAISPSLKIVVTEFARPFFEDRLMPLGRLRESISNLKRAQALVVSKCPDSLNAAQKAEFIAKTKANMPVFFSKIRYLEARNSEGQVLDKGSAVLLICGIAKADLFIEYAEKNFQVAEKKTFADHFAYTTSHLASFGKIKLPILTTEKDFTKLSKAGLHVFFVPIEVDISTDFKDFIYEELKKFYTF